MPNLYALDCGAGLGEGLYRFVHRGTHLRRYGIDIEVWAIGDLPPP